MKNLVSAVALSLLLWSCSGDKGTNNTPPQVPTTPNTPSPAHLATGQEVSLILTWQCSHPLDDSLSYDVYFGASSTPPLVTSVYGTASYQTGQLENATTYYWKIAARDNAGHVTNSPVWAFTTLGNRAPIIPSAPSPENMLVGHLYSGSVFRWTSSDPDGDPVTYDLHIGTTNPPTVAKSALTGATYTSTALDWFYTLSTNTIYYWRVVAHDNKGLSTESPVWQFRTNRAMTVVGTLDPGGTLTDIALRESQLLVVDYGARLLSVDVTNPASPVLRQALTMSGIGAVAAYGNYALVARSGSLQVWNASNPTDLYHVATGQLSGVNPPYRIRVSGSRVYVSSVANGSSQGFVDMFLMTDSLPTLLGTVSDPVTVWHMAAAGNALYVGSWGKAYDVTTPSSATEISTGLPWMHTHTAGPDLAIDETNQMYGLYNSTLYSVDITNPLQPVLTDSLPLEFSVTGHTGMFARGRKAYVATRSTIGPFFCVDGSDPATLKFLSWYHFNNMWGEAVVANAVNVYVAASGNGILILGW